MAHATVRKQYVAVAAVKPSNNREPTGQLSTIDVGLTRTVRDPNGIEEGPQVQHLSESERICEEHFKANVARNEEGRYSVALPFSDKIDKLGESKRQAMKRLVSLERKLQQNQSIKQQYHAVIQEYLDLGHMSEVMVDNTDHHGYYLPHHGVIKTTSQTIKLRVVFDGSAQSSTGVSLNNALHTGPKIQEDLLYILLRFRIHRYVLTGDIEKMYRQFLVRPKDRKYQRVLWRDANGQVKTFELNTITFGLSSAPYLAIRCLNKLAEDEGHRYPSAAKIIQRDFYVSDALTGASTKEEALRLREELTLLLKGAGLNIRQWASNDRDLLHGLAEKELNRNLEIGESSTLKTLGIFWNSTNDSIHYALPLLNNVTFQWKAIVDSAVKLELHGFCDASEKAYGACVYLRSIDEHGRIRIELLVAKSRVAPLKSHTIPRLELCGALLLVSLAKTVENALHIPINHSFYWTDSTIVLHWLNTPPNTLKTFVANRVAEIQGKTSISNWRHVRTKDNPADIISRGQTAEEFLQLSIWHHGPPWLAKNQTHWPTWEAPVVNDIPEQKMTICLATNVIDASILERYSSWEKLVRVVARCLRWRPKQSAKGVLTTSELQHARNSLIQLLQQLHFSDELQCLNKGRLSGIKGKLQKLNPFIDKEGILRHSSLKASIEYNYMQEHKQHSTLSGSATGPSMGGARTLHKQFANSLLWGSRIINPKGRELQKALTTNGYRVLSTDWDNFKLYLDDHINLAIPIKTETDTERAVQKLTETIQHTA
ncbi:PREDICTED: uncharacterized protein LOC108573940 [Habropoda laboriosa]|uniref:uncharacterized protein LOC108573940 n=1 Tax=Habropoda laboriosa TaxID=597456 RepID=UPI00083CC3E7|nr:PREDICTED: uncharacterized protein LOC108573940 [Habropoda laboriosa]